MKAGWLLAAALPALAAGLAITVVDPIILAMTASLVAAVGVMRAKREHFLLSPTGPLVLVVLTSGFLPAVTGYLRSAPLFGVSHDDYARASVAFLLFVGCALVVYAPPARARRSKAPAADQPVLLKDAELLLRRSFQLWMAFVLLAAGILATTIATAGGLSSYVAELADRRVFFSGRVYIAWILSAPAVASLVVLACYGRLPRLRRSRNRVAIGLIVAVSVALGVFTGGRMNIVTYAAALAVVVHRCVRPIRVREAAIGVLVVGAFGLTVPSFLRPSDPNNRSLEVRSLATSYEAINKTGAVSEFGQVAGLALVMADPRRIEYQYGSTYAAIATMGLPRVIAPWKPPTANALVTERLLPDVWYGSGTGIQMTAVGEAFLNFGWIGVVLLGFVFGALMRPLSRLQWHREVPAVLVYAVSLPRVALLLRGDSATVFSFLIMDLVVVLICTAALATSTQSLARLAPASRVTT